MDKSIILNDNKSMPSPLEVVFSEELINIFDHITRALGFRMSILDTTFQEIAPLKLQPSSGYCRIIQEEMGLLHACRENDRKQCMAAEKRGGVIQYTCHAGLMEAIYPFFDGEECIAWFVVGQFRMEGETPGRILFRAKPDIKKKLFAEYEKLPVYNREKLTSVLEIIRITTEYITEHRMVSVRQNLLADRLMSFITENRSRNPGVEEAARAVNKSASTINRTLKAVTGKSFKQLSLSVKMEEAARLLKEEPDLPVAEVGTKVGIEDPFYFSRVFKKFYASSPREYRRS